MRYLCLIPILLLCGCATTATGRVKQIAKHEVEITVSANSSVTVDFYESGDVKSAELDNKKEPAGIIQIGTKTAEYLILDEVSN